MFADIQFGKRWSNGIGLVEWDQMTQQYISQTTFEQNTLGGRNWYVFGRCNLQTIGILDYLQEYPSQFSTIKKHNK